MHSQGNSCEALKQLKAAKSLNSGEMSRRGLLQLYDSVRSSPCRQRCLGRRAIQEHSFGDRRPHIQFHGDTPLIFLKNIRLGALCIFDTKPGSFSLAIRQGRASALCPTGCAGHRNKRFAEPLKLIRSVQPAGLVQEPRQTLLLSARARCCKGTYALSRVFLFFWNASARHWIDPGMPYPKASCLRPTGFPALTSRRHGLGRATSRCPFRLKSGFGG
jgi:hypothetical protein